MALRGGEQGKLQLTPLEEGGLPATGRGARPFPWAAEVGSRRDGVGTRERGEDPGRSGGQGEVLRDLAAGSKRF